MGSAVQYLRVRCDGGGKSTTHPNLIFLIAQSVTTSPNRLQPTGILNINGS